MKRRKRIDNTEILQYETWRELVRHIEMRESFAEAIVLHMNNEISRETLFGKIVSKHATELAKDDK